MRIIAGECRGLHLMAPKGRNTRPMTDRVRESLFSSLGSEFGTPGCLPDMPIMDLFAGTGALGLEGVSRGAKLCCFVERAPAALSALRQNIRNLKLEGRCWVVSGDAFVCDLPAAPDGGGWPLIFLDPPYPTASVHIDTQSVPNLLMGLGDGELLADGALLILRHPLQVDYERRIGRLSPDRTKVYGTTKFTWFRYSRQLG